MANRARRNGPPGVRTSRIYENQWLKLQEEVVERPDGNNETFGVIEMAPGSSVVVLDDRLQTYMVSEFRHALGCECIELPGGGHRPGESPLAAAQRELMEELGIAARRWTALGVVNAFSSVVRAPNFIFLARDLAFGVARPDEKEIVRPVKTSFGEAVQMVWDGRITHAASCVAILKTAVMLQVKPHDIR